MIKGPSFADFAVALAWFRIQLDCLLGLLWAVPSLMIIVFGRLGTWLLAKLSFLSAMFGLSFPSFLFVAAFSSLRRFFFLPCASKFSSCRAKATCHDMLKFGNLLLEIACVTISLLFG